MDFTMIEQQLQQEEQGGPPMSRAELVERLASRAVLGNELETVQAQVKTLTNRYHRLAKFPGMAHVQWASALLRFSNLVFLVIDSTGVQNDSDVIRVLVADVEGSPIFDRIVRPTRQPGQPNTGYTGIIYNQIKDAPTLADIWTDVQAMLAGRYVLTYNWDFLKKRLDENAEHYGLQPLYFLGECLMERAVNYYQVSYPLKLTDICARVGLTVGQQATAPDRAVGQLTFLRAMAEGITNVHHVPSAAITTFVEEDDGLGPLDDHPF